LGGPGENLDDLLLDLDTLWIEYESCSGLKDLDKLRETAVALYSRFTKWQDSRATELNPTRIGIIYENGCETQVAVGHWPGKVDTYFDLCVAGTWNIFRTARLLLIALIMKLSVASSDTGSCVDFVQDANSIAEEMIASIPFHLADNLHVFLGELSTSADIPETGRTLGGFLLIHPLYVASRMAFLSGPVRDYLRRCLAWIGSRMGIGQAALFSSVSRFDPHFNVHLMVHIADFLPLECRHWLGICSKWMYGSMVGIPAVVNLKYSASE
jgi:hypothetical protein